MKNRFVYGFDLGVSAFILFSGCCIPGVFSLNNGGNHETSEELPVFLDWRLLDSYETRARSRNVSFDASA